MNTEPVVNNSWRRFWSGGTWWKAALAVIGYLVVYELCALGIGTLWAGSVDLTNPLADAFTTFITLALPLIVGAVFLLVFVASLRWFPAIFGRQPIRGRWWMWIFVVLALIPIVLRLFGIEYSQYASGVVPMAFLSGVFIGLTEELLYRGIVVKILRNGGHRELTVALISSTLFALSHCMNLLGGQPLLTVALTVVFTFGFGMMMYLILRVTGNIIWPMIVHALTDPTTFLSSGGIDTVSAHEPSALVGLAAPFNIIFVIAALIALIFIRGRVNTTDGAPNT